MKTKVILHGTNHYNDWNSGELGYIDGYVTGGDGKPYAVIVLDKDKSIVLAPISNLEAVGFVEN